MGKFQKRSCVIGGLLSTLGCIPTQGKVAGLLDASICLLHDKWVRYTHFKKTFYVTLCARGVQWLLIYSRDLVPPLPKVSILRKIFHFGRYLSPGTLILPVIHQVRHLDIFAGELPGSLAWSRSLTAFLSSPFLANIAAAIRSEIQSSCKPWLPTTKELWPGTNVLLRLPILAVVKLFSEPFCFLNVASGRGQFDRVVCQRCPCRWREKEEG